MEDLPVRGGAVDGANCSSLFVLFLLRVFVLWCVHVSSVVHPTVTELPPPLSILCLRR